MAKKSANPLESEIEQRLVERVKARDGMCIKFKDPSRRGAPDRIVCLFGHPTYFVELKRPKNGQLGKHQSRYHRDLRAAGQEVFTLWSHEDVDEFLAVL